MKQQTIKVNGWKLGLLSMLSIMLFITLGCREEKSAPEGDTAKSAQTQEQRETFTIVEEQPSYEGGFDAFYKYVMSEIRYPAQARKAGIEGTVKVQFDIERDGSVSNAQALNSISKAADAEAVRVVFKAPGFKAGSQRGRTVRSTMIVPITFVLNPSKRSADNTAQGAIVAGEVTPKNSQLIVESKYKAGAWSGTVYSADKEKLVGVNIVVEGTNYGTVSDLDGTFSVQATKDQRLQISRVGYDNVIIQQ